MNNKLMMLMILSGFGINDNEEGNAIKLANTPCIDRLMNEYPTTKIYTSGLAVGLPEGQMGNSEVGHTIIEAGRNVDQVLTRITKSIEDGEFFTIQEFNNAIENCKKYNSKLHIMGLLSNGGVHSHNRHLYALLEYAKRKGLEDVFIHCFMDGRDTPPASGEYFLSELQEKLDEKQIGKIATISGRYYAMDRDKNWDRIQLVYDAIVNGNGQRTSSSIKEIEDSYQKEIFDEFVVPTVICNNQSEPIAKIEEHDSIIFFNFRPDRAIQLTRALVDNEFNIFNTKKLDLYFVTFTQYDENLKNVNTAFKPIYLKNTFGEYIKKLGYRQLIVKDTEKNSNEQEITNRVIEAINEEKYDNIILNYENPDILGHTGNLDATINAIEELDKCIEKVVKAVEKKDGILIITSDYGNSEQMIDYETGEPLTSHTTNPVPLILIGAGDIELKEGKLADIAPTMLDIMGINKPKEMTGESIIIK